mgnify:CR=1 FL=1
MGINPDQNWINRGAVFALNVKQDHQINTYSYCSGKWPILENLIQGVSPIIVNVQFQDFFRYCNFQIYVQSSFKVLVVYENKWIELPCLLNTQLLLSSGNSFI